MIDNHTPARGILDMFTGQGLAQDLVESQGSAIACRKTYPGCRGMGCDYNIIVHLEKFSQLALKKAYFNCKFCGNSPEVVAKWVIMMMFSPRVKHDQVPP